MRISDWSSDVCSSDLAGDRIFVHITRTAEELEALVHDLPLKVGVPQLRRGALFGGELLLHVPRERPVEVGPADLHLGLQIGAQEAAVLELEDLLAHGLAFAGIDRQRVRSGMRVSSR